MDDKWSEQEINDLKSLIKTATYKEISVKLNRTIDAIRAQVKKNDLKKYIINRADPAQDVKYFNHSEKNGIKQTAQHFSATIDEVKNARRRVFKKRERIRSAMTQERFKKIRFACFKTINKYGIYTIDNDDFVSWAITKILEGRDTTIDNLLWDYISETQGEEHCLNKTAKNSLLKHPIPLKDDPDPEVEGIILEAPEQPKHGVNMFSIADLLKLDGNDRLAFLLYFREDFSLKEIAAYLSLTESRVSQIITAIKDRMVKHAELKSVLSE